MDKIFLSLSFFYKLNKVESNRQRLAGNRRRLAGNRRWLVGVQIWLTTGHSSFFFFFHEIMSCQLHRVDTCL